MILFLRKLVPMNRIGFICFSLLIFAIGCGGGNAPVSGVITLDGTPLPGVYVVFEPQAVGPAGASQGGTASDGKYELARVEGGKKGALIGTHQVRLTTVSPGAMDDERSALPQDKIPAKYQRAAPTFDVPRDGTDTANFELSSQ